LLTKHKKEREGRWIAGGCSEPLGTGSGEDRVEGEVWNELPNTHIRREGIVEIKWSAKLLPSTGPEGRGRRAGAGVSC
jgi:hypothetical protein